MTPTGNLRIVLDNVTVQVELHFCGMEGRAIARLLSACRWWKIFHCLSHGRTTP